MPAKYSDQERKQIQDGFCRLIASGMSAKKACQVKGMVAESTVFAWLYEDEAFSEQYARARERRADARAERIDAICDEVRSGELKADAARVIIDAEKWQAGKENAKRYGDKMTNEIVGKDGAALIPVINVTVGRDQPQPSS